MIFIADGNWLTYPAAAVVLVIVGVIAFWAVRRWGWRAWPLLLCSTLLVPVLVCASIAVALYFIDRSLGLAGGFVVHLDWLILTAMLPTIVGASVGSVWRRRAAHGS